MGVIRKLLSFRTKHTDYPDEPQDYGEHWRVAVPISSKMIFYGIGGIIHGFLPEIKSLQFSTSTFLFNATMRLMMRKRHNKEVEEIFGPDIFAAILRERERREAQANKAPTV